MSLVLSGFEAGKRNFLQLTDKDGEQPQIASVSHYISNLTGFKKTNKENNNKKYISIYCSFNLFFILSNVLSIVLSKF